MNVEMNRATAVRCCAGVMTVVLHPDEDRQAFLVRVEELKDDQERTPDGSCQGSRWNHSSDNPPAARANNSAMRMYCEAASWRSTRYPRELPMCRYT